MKNLQMLGQAPLEKSVEGIGAPPSRSLLNPSILTLCPRFPQEEP